MTEGVEQIEYNMFFSSFDHAVNCSNNLEALKSIIILTIKYDIAGFIKLYILL